MKNARSLNNSDFCFIKYFTEKVLKMSEKKVHVQSLSLRVRNNPCNFISNGPILLVWVTHGKFEPKTFHDQTAS